MKEKCVIFYNSTKAKAVEIYTDLKKFFERKKYISPTKRKNY